MGVESSKPSMYLYEYVETVLLNMPSSETILGARYHDGHDRIPSSCESKKTESDTLIMRQRASLNASHPSSLGTHHLAG